MLKRICHSTYVRALTVVCGLVAILVAAGAPSSARR